MEHYGWVLLNLVVSIVYAPKATNWLWMTTHTFLPAAILDRIGIGSKISSKAESHRLFFLNGKQDVSAFLLVDLGIIMYPAYSCIIFRTDFLSSK
ncbi:hypothetical protein NC652_033575 [Populus alba x Populus x berolinensis]|nr:hypothetical protein NC652_033575 [Populus alba x Populus x berolinensis]